MSKKVPSITEDLNGLMDSFLKKNNVIEQESEEEMFFSIILGCLIITTENAKATIQLDEIVAFELVDTDDGGIASFTLKGNPTELVYNCKNKASWKQVLKWFDDYEMEIIEGMTQAVKKEKKKARF